MSEPSWSPIGGARRPKNTIWRANLPGGVGPIARVILISSHLPAPSHTLAHKPLRSHPLAVRHWGCFIAVWNCFGMSLMVGRGQPQMFGPASVLCARACVCVNGLLDRTCILRTEIERGREWEVVFAWLRSKWGRFRPISASDYAGCVSRLILWSNCGLVEALAARWTSHRRLKRPGSDFFSPCTTPVWSFHDSMNDTDPMFFFLNPGHGRTGIWLLSAQAFTSTVWLYKLIVLGTGKPILISTATHWLLIAKHSLTTL